jgi:TolA protein
VTDKPDASTDTASIVNQQLAEQGQQDVDVLPVTGDVIEESEQSDANVVSTPGVSAVEPEKIVVQDNAEDKEAQRQRILMELRAESDVLEKARRETEAVERASLEAKLEKAARAQAAAEAKAKQEAEARIRAEAAAKAATQAKATAEAKAKAAIKAKEDQARVRTEAKARATLKAEQEKAQAQAKAEAAKTAYIKVDELTQVLGTFTSAYKAGDIEQFMALFSTDAKTNDRNTLRGIREDYVGLFAGTVLRKIDFNDMQWKWERGVSHGEGTYVVKVQQNGQGKIDVYRGHLRISVGRYGSKLLISSFAFE